MGGTTQSSGGGHNSSTPGAFSWNGGSTPSTIDPKTFGTKLLGNLDTAFNKGPQAPIPSYNPFTQQTSDLINTGLGQVSSNNSTLAPWANGSMIGSSNPFLNDYIKQTNDQVGTATNAAFNSSGLYGSDVHAKGLAEGLANADNTARFNQYNTDVGNMFQAQGAQNANTATGLGYSGLLDSKNAEQIASNREQQAATDPYNYILKYLNAGNNPQNTSNTNQPTSLWNILGGVGSVLGSFL